MLKAYILYSTPAGAFIIYIYIYILFTKQYNILAAFYINCSYIKLGVSQDSKNWSFRYFLLKINNTFSNSLINYDILRLPRIISILGLINLINIFNL